MKLKFFIKVAPKKSDTVNTVTIYSRLTIGHKLDSQCRLPLAINPNLWDPKNQCVKSRAVCDEMLRRDLNTKLSELRVFIQREFTKIDFPHKDWLREQIQAFFGVTKLTRETRKDYTKDTFFSLFDKFLEQNIKTKTRRQHYISLRERLERFQAYQSLVKKDKLFKYNIHTFNNDLFIEFSEYLTHEYDYIGIYPQIFEAVPYSKYYKPRPMGENTLNHIQINLRGFLKWAYVEEYTANHSYMQFKIKPNHYGTPYYLTIEERDRLYNFEFPESQFKAKYEMERDTFVFQCLVGCRISDEKSFTKDNFNNGFLEYIPIKTRNVTTKTVRVPLVPKAQAILDKYKDRTFRNGQIFHFYQFSIYEEDLKTIFKIAGLDRSITVYNARTGLEEKRPLYELASTHLARRTFIGNLYKKVQDPNIIASMSGHADGSKAFLRYRAIDDSIKNDAIKYIE